MKSSDETTALGQFLGQLIPGQRTGGHGTESNRPANEDTPSRFTPSRRNVVRAAAWSVPVVSLATAAPAFATSPGVGQDQVVFTSSLFWRPTTAEANAFGEGFYWSISGIPDRAVMWVTQLTNPGVAMTGNINLSLAVPDDGTANKEFTVINAPDLTVTPAVFQTTQRAADGRLALVVAPLPDSTPKSVTVAVLAPNSLQRGAVASWPLTVTPPASGATISMPIQTYTQFRNSIPS